MFVITETFRNYPPSVYGPYKTIEFAQSVANEIIRENGVDNDGEQWVSVVELPDQVEDIDRVE